MKTKVLLLALVLLYSFHSKAAPSLAPEEEAHFKEQAHAMLVDYYTGLNYYFTKIDAAQKDYMTTQAINGNFRSSTATVYNDYQKGAHIKQMSIQEYLDQLNVLYGDDKLGITLIATSINVEGVYVQGDSFFVKTVVNLSLTSSTNPELNNAAVVDYYSSFIPAKEDIRIFRMTSHEENTANLVPATIKNKDYIISTPNTNPAILATQEVNPAFLTFKVSPGNATLSIDGKPVYFVNGLKITAAPGTKRIEITAPGYQPYMLNNFNVNEGNNNINAELVQNMGALTVEARTKKAGAAKVLVDGKFVGNIPVLRYGLSEGLHSVQIVKEGFFSKRKNVNIKAQQDEPWKVDLINIENTKKGVSTALGVLGSFLH